jgi:hypothetical protein
MIEFCISEKKDDKLLCNSCIRNINVWDVTDTTKTNEYKLIKRMTKDGVTMKCSGYLNTND